MGDNTERKMMRKKAFDNKYLGFKSSTANKAKAMIRTIMPNPLRNIGSRASRICYPVRSRNKGSRRTGRNNSFLPLSRNETANVATGTTKNR